MEKFVCKAKKSQEYLKEKNNLLMCVEELLDHLILGNLIGKMVGKMRRMVLNNSCELILYK